MALGARVVSLLGLGVGGDLASVGQGLDEGRVVVVHVELILGARVGVKLRMSSLKGINRKVIHLILDSLTSKN